MYNANYLNLAESEIDRHIYRIMPQEFVFQLFETQKNVLCQSRIWKDKFENLQLALGGVLDGVKFEYDFKNDFVGQCWTREYLSEAMWGIYANDPTKRYLRIRSTPRKLLAALAGAHSNASQDTCFIGTVEYLRETKLKAYIESTDRLKMSAADFAKSLLLKRRAFRHESEVRLLYFGSSSQYDERGLYRYRVNPHQIITQIMADPNRDKRAWKEDKAEIKTATGFSGEIKRSKIYDAPSWAPPVYNQ